MFKCCLLLVFVASATAWPREKRDLGEDLDTFRQKCFDCHNKYRAIHQVGPLEFDDELTTYAQNYAEKLAEMDPYPAKMPPHSQGPYGENILAGNGSLPGSLPCEAWYSEVHNYHDYSAENPDNFFSVGHFTQMVWKATERMGLGAATADSGMTYIVGSYDPRGNIRGTYNQNVFPPQ